MRDSVPGVDVAQTAAASELFESVQLQRYESV
jgi:hypothetical protein